MKGMIDLFCGCKNTDEAWPIVWLNVMLYPCAVKGINRCLARHLEGNPNCNINSAFQDYHTLNSLNSSVNLKGTWVVVCIPGP